MNGSHRSAFTLVEVIIVIAIVSILLAVLASMVNIGEISRSRDMEKINLFREARQIMYQIARDVRQTTSQEISDNGPTSSHVKFRIYSDYNATLETPIWSGGYIEYSYDPANQTLTRSDANTGLTKSFNNVVTVPFNTSLLSNNKLIATIETERPFRGSNITSNLTTEIKIRNE